MSSPSSLGPGGVAVTTQYMSIQRKTTILVSLNGQGLPTVLTLVTFHVEVFVKSYHPHGLVSARFRHDGFRTNRAAWGILPVIVRDTVGPVSLVHNEGGAFQGTGTDHTGEALGMKGPARSSQHPLSDWLSTRATLLQSVLIALLTVRCPFKAIELLPLQLPLALVACETCDVEQAPKSPDRRLGTYQGLVASTTPLIGGGLVTGWLLHVFH